MLEYLLLPIYLTYLNEACVASVLNNGLKSPSQSLKVALLNKIVCRY